MCFSSRATPSNSRPMIEKTAPSSSDRVPNSNYRNYPNPYQNCPPCEPYYHHQPPSPGPSYPHNYQAPCPCQSPFVRSCCANEVKKANGSFKLPIFLFILFIVSVVIAYNYIRGLLNQRNENISGMANPSYLLNQNPQSVAIGEQAIRIRKRNAQQNWPAEFVHYNNGIIEPSPSTEEDDLPQTSSPGQSMSRPTSVDRGRRTQIKNGSIESSFKKTLKPQEISSKNNKKNTGTSMTDDEKSAFLLKN